MSRANPLISTFNGGELSPMMRGRPDLAKYANGCTKLSNMIPTVQGPAKRRGGMRFVSAAKIDDQVAWLGRFEFNFQQAYILEFTPGFIRFYTNRAQLLASGSPYQVATPYTAADLTNDEGCFGLDIEQRGDVLYIACPGHPTQTLTRLAPTNWVLAAFVTKGGPLLDQNPDKSLRVYASAQTGNVTVTASAATFTANHIGALLRIDLENIDIPPWEPAKVIAPNALRRSDGKTYKAMNADNAIITGSKLPIHEFGTVLDGSGQTTDTVPKTIGISWRFEDPGYGIGRITAVTDSTHATVAVDPDYPFPAGVVGSGNATNQWQYGAWGAHAEYPSQVFFWKSRLGFAGKRSFWLSVPRAYDDFSRDIVGQVRADAGITAEIETTQKISFMEPAEILLAGTESSEFIVHKGNESEALGPANIDADPKTAYGSRKLRAVAAGDGIMFAQKSGRRVRQARTSKDTGDYEAPDMTVLSEHITLSGIVDWAWQSEPDRILWCVLANGKLIAMTMERDQDVQAWHQHPTDGHVEAVQVIPAPDGTRQDVWLLVKRTVGGLTKRYVEYMDRGFDPGDSQASSFFLDSGLSYSGTPVITISGLDHLVGREVAVLVNGGTHPPRVVNNAGSITLQNPGSVVHVGLAMRSVLIPMPILGGAQMGPGLGKTKRINKVGIQFLQTLGCKHGPTEDNLITIPFRNSSMPTPAAPVLFTGIVEVDFDGNYENEAELVIVQDDPLPMTILSLGPELVTNERS